MSVQLHNTRMPEYGETIYSDDAVETVETLQHIYTLADARQDFDNDKWMYVGDDFTLEWIEMSPELATEVSIALQDEGNVALADQIGECIAEARKKWGQDAVRLEIW